MSLVKNVKKIKESRLTLLLVILSSLFVFSPVINSYFSQDDFFHFIVSRTDGGFFGFVRLFGFYPFEARGIAFYRPVFRELVYFASFNLFGLSSFPLRLLEIIIHIINTYLVYRVSIKLTKSIPTGIFAALLFSISSTNTSILYYLAGGIQTSGATMFILLFILCFSKYLENESLKWWNISFVIYLFGLGSHEQAATIPLLGLGLMLLRTKVIDRDFLRKSVIRFWPYAVVTFLYLYLEVFVIGFSDSEVVYQPVLSIKSILNGFGWYVGWTWGLPEMLIDFVRSGLSLDPRLMRYWGDYFNFIFPSFFISVFVFLFILLSSVKVLKKNIKIIIFFAGWYISVMLPMVFLPLHKSTHYLAPAMPAFWIAFFYIVFSWVGEVKNGKFKMLILISLLGSLLSLNLASVKLGEKTHWAVSRGRIASELVGQIKNKYPELPKGTVVYILNDPEYPYISDNWGGTSTQAMVVLSGDDALQLLYDDPSLRVFYEDNDQRPQLDYFDFVARYEY